MRKSENTALEIRLLLEGIYQKYGYDFRGYSEASITRRILRRLADSGLPSVSALQHEVLHDPPSFALLLRELTVNVTEMFRDPSFFRALRTAVLPALRDHPHLRIWHAGCATGEEVYSMAILLNEVGLHKRSQIYATDIDREVLNCAREGVYPVERIRKYTANYQRAGGTESFADYYRAQHGAAVMRKSLKETICFSEHNLATDGPFGEMSLIVCRNVLIYFGRNLQHRALHLLNVSLTRDGFLALGTQESIQFAPCVGDFARVAGSEAIYRRRPQSGRAASLRVA